MQGLGGDPSDSAAGSGHSVKAWRQGDYSVTAAEFLVADSFESGELGATFDKVIGLVVITQTCDIVNDARGKEFVTMCPLIELTEKSREEVQRGRSPTAAALDCPPSQNAVADLGRMMSVHKSVLAQLERKEGFSTDAGRAKFAEALQRKHGRFAFPDKFSDEVLGKLRRRLIESHGKEASEHGKAYRSIRTVRVTAFPDWDSLDVTVAFHFVLEPENAREATREQISKTLNEHLGKLVWPAGYRAADPQYHLVTLEDMTAAEWVSSQPIDWDFVSYVGRAVPANARLPG